MKARVELEHFIFFPLILPKKVEVVARSGFNSRGLMRLFSSSSFWLNKYVGQGCFSI